jgi:hypothetical protein
MSPIILLPQYEDEANREASVFHQQDIQKAWSVDTLDPRHLNIRSGRWAGEERNRACWVEPREGFGQRLHDLRGFNDAEMIVRQQRQDPSPLRSTMLQRDAP